MLNNVMNAQSFPGEPPSSKSQQARGEALYHDYFRANCARTDQMFAVLMFVQWIGAIVTACLISPHTWIGETSTLHIHVWMAIGLGGLVSAFPIYLALTAPGEATTRHGIAFAQAIWSALLIHLSGGRLETHFHIFGSLAFLAFYRDWRVLITFSVVTAVDHFVRGYWWPLSVYGVMMESPLRWIEHAGWVVFEDIFLIISCLRGQAEGRSLCDRQASLEATISTIEETVEQRTRELSEAKGFLNAVFNSVDSLICTLDDSGLVLQSNARWKALSRHLLSKDHLKPANYLDIANSAFHQPPTKQSIAEAIEEVRRKQCGSYSTEVRLGNGQHARWFQVDILPFRHNLENAVVVVHTEITDRVSAEQERERLHHDLQTASRQAGMAEVATGVLHNVGNVLNSVNVSANVVIENLQRSKTTVLKKVTGTVEEHSSDLSTFLVSDPRGQHFPRLLAELTQKICQEQDEMRTELSCLVEHLSHIKSIVSMQQSIAKVGGVAETLNVEELVEQAVAFNRSGMERHGIDFQLDFDDVPDVTLDRHKVLQILVNLVGNAKQAMESTPIDQRQLTVSTRYDGDQVSIAVRDTGMGITSENLSKIFSHGFTTKKDGHGFGLHSSALAAQEIGGSLSVHSDGPGLGATFVLRVPVRKEVLCNQ